MSNSRYFIQAAEITGGVVTLFQFSPILGIAIALVIILALINNYDDDEEE